MVWKWTNSNLLPYSFQEKNDIFWVVFGSEFQLQYHVVAFDPSSRSWGHSSQTTLRLNRQGAEDLYVMELSWQVVAEMLCFSKWESIWKYILICAKNTRVYWKWLISTVSVRNLIELVNTMYNLHDVKSFLFQHVSTIRCIHFLYMFPAADLPKSSKSLIWEEENPYQYDLSG